MGVLDWRDPEGRPVRAVAMCWMDNAQDLPAGAGWTRLAMDNYEYRQPAEHGPTFAGIGHGDQGGNQLCPDLPGLYYAQGSVRVALGAAPVFPITLELALTTGPANGGTPGASGFQRDGDVRTIRAGAQADQHTLKAAYMDAFDVTECVGLWMRNTSTTDLSIPGGAVTALFLTRVVAGPGHGDFF